MNFIGSPELVIALALGGSLSFNPLKDSLETPSGKFKLEPPEIAPDVPSKGFNNARDGYVLPSQNPESVQVRSARRTRRTRCRGRRRPWPRSGAAWRTLMVKTKGK